MTKIPNISVAILNADEISFVLYGNFRLENSDETIRGEFAAKLEDGKIIVIQDDKKIEIEENSGFSPIDKENDTFMIRDVVIGIDFHWEQKRNQKFLGAIKFVKENGRVTALNYLSAEDYLVSVISSEMSPTSSLELLKAHSIISRSWLFAQIKRKEKGKIAEVKNKYFTDNHNERIRWYDREDHLLYDVCADDHCQRYQGVTKLFAHNAQAAVELTRGMVLYYEDEICDARFSKSCGGITEAFENVWEPRAFPYLQSVVDFKYYPDDFEPDLTVEENAVKWIKGNPPAFCNTTDEKVISEFLVDYDQETKDFYRWKIEYSQSELTNILRRKTGIDFGEILDLLPMERGYSGRLIRLKIIGSKKSLIIGKELEIRNALAESHLYSSAIAIDKLNIENGVPGKFVIWGAGWGHGVGLCQIGAAVMAEMGYKFDEILNHYFKNTIIKKIY